MNDNLLPIFMSMSMFLIFFASISLWVWIDNRSKTRKRELEHAERMRAIERGTPLQDQAVSRNQALGAIGVAVPIVSMCAAAVTSLVLPFAEIAIGLRLLLLALAWGVAGGISWVAISGVLVQLKKQTVPIPFREEVPDEEGQEVHEDDFVAEMKDSAPRDEGRFSSWQHGG